MSPASLLTKQLVIITGASRGMGLAIAKALVASNTQLLCISRKTNAELTALAKSEDCHLDQWSADLAESDHVGSKLSKWLRGFDSARLQSAWLINNAGVIPSIVPLGQAAPGELNNALRVGLEAPMQMTAAFLNGTKDWANDKRILNVSSGLGRRAMASSASYCAAKAGMDHFSRAVALEEALKLNGAKICSLAPGVIDTDMQVQLRAGAPSDFPDHANFVKMKEQGALMSPEQAAEKLIAYIRRDDFGKNPVADIRDPA